MVKIRLSRVGKRKQPSYRVVVADIRSARDGSFIEIIGHYNPRTEPATIVIDAEKAKQWLSRGAQPTERVSILLGKAGITEMPKINFSKKPPKKKSEEQPSQEPKEAVKEPAAELKAETKEAAKEPAAEPKAETKAS
jgi:small subunit ribosomal protein S16